MSSDQMFLIVWLLSHFQKLKCIFFAGHRYTNVVRRMISSDLGLLILMGSTCSGKCDSIRDSFFLANIFLYNKKTYVTEIL